MDLVVVVNNLDFRLLPLQLGGSLTNKQQLALKMFYFTKFLAYLSNKLTIFLKITNLQIAFFVVNIVLSVP